MIHFYGWLGNIFFIIGGILLAKKHYYGWYAQMIANFCYVIYALFLGTDGVSLGFLSFILACINIFGLIQWEKESKNG